MVLGKMLSVVLTGAALLSGSKNAALPEKNINGDIFLVNRQHVISEQYVPDSLRKTQVHGMSQSMREEAAAALEELFQAAQSEGVKLSSVSGYRSYSKQSLIYSRKVGRTGSEAEADKLVARPGTSEHQLGLAMDLATRDSSTLSERFASTAEGQWVYANCQRFGFIVRYLKGYEDVTGYSYEPWHIRYVGRENAEAIAASGLPLETYLSGWKLELYDYLIHQAMN